MRSLAREGRQPAWHHHLARPVAASLVMVPVCLVLQRWHVMLAVLGGAVTYCVILVSLGGLRRTRLWRSAFLPHSAPSALAPIRQRVVSSYERSASGATGGRR